MEEKLEKRVLLAVDDSVYALKAAEYIVRMFKDDEDFHVNIIHAMPPLPPILFEAKQDDAEFARWQSIYRPKLEKRYKERANNILQKVTAFLSGMGFKENRFKTISLVGRHNPAADLLFYAEHGLFDALVLGQCGVGRWKKMIVGSVTDKIIHAEKTVPVWVVAEPTSSKKVLIALDGSENATRAVDHTGFILSEREDIEIILLHVINIGFANDIYLPENWVDIAEKAVFSIMENAKGMLIKAGVPENKIKTIIQTTGEDVARKIIEFQENENIGTIIMGRRGISGLKTFFLGSISAKVLSLLEKGAIWLVD